MNSHIGFAFSLAGLLFIPIGHADEDDTVTVVDQGDTPADVASHITLPEAASGSGSEQAAIGLGVANQARDLGREFEQQISEQVRDAHSDASGNAGGHGG